MKYRDFFENAFSEAFEKAPFSDDEAFIETVKKRTEMSDAMKKEDKTRQITFAEITPEHIESKMSHKVLNAVVGVAGAAAVLAGAVFGLNWLSEHGGLKGPDVQGAGAGSSAASETELLYTMPAKEGEEFVAPDFDLPVPETLPDIRFAYGNKLIFHDAEVTLSGINYDGNKLEAFFDLLYTGDDYENYSPLYARVDINYTMTDGEIEYIQSDDYEENFTCQLFENPEPDSSFIVVYTVPIKLEPNKDYAVSIAYFNPDHNGQNGSSTQGIEADRLRYKYVYKPSQKSGLNELPDITGLNIDDAKEILENAHINYSISRHASDEVPENCVIRTLPQAGAEINSSVIVSISVSSSVPAVFDDFAAAGKVYGLDLLDFGVGVKVHAAQVFGCEIIQASKYMENVQFNEDGTIGGEVPTTIGSPNESRGSIKPEFHTQTVILADTLEERMNGFKNMISNNIEDCEHESYYSEKLGLTVDVYYGRTGNVSNGFGTENITSVAVFDDGDVLYILSIENTACLADVETAARKVTDYDQKNGYYEGEEAIDILKQYAGEDYCFPFEKLEKEKVSYYDGDKWTNTNEIKFNFAVGEEGVPIMAITSGTVIKTFSRNVPGYADGIYITIQAADGRKWRYRHLSDFYVNEGDTVRAGDVIAAVGATGWCTGPCLSIVFPDSEVVDPVARSGYYSDVIDPVAHPGYYEGEEALEILKQYAGTDYCFPLEELKTDVRAYRTQGTWTDSTYGTWTADETRTGYDFNIPAEKGEPIFAVTGGTVIEIFSKNVHVNGEYTYIFITIQAADGRKWRYDCLSDFYVSEGDTVKAGDKIAAVGATGGGTPLVDIYVPDSEVIDPAEDTNNTTE